MIYYKNKFKLFILAKKILKSKFGKDLTPSKEFKEPLLKVYNYLFDH